MEKQKEVYGIIYVIKNKINGKLYIGQTINRRGFKGRYGQLGDGVERVYNQLIYKRNHEQYYNKHLLCSIEKYGFNAFGVDEKFDIAYSQEELNKLEYMYIEIYQCRNSDYGYNDRYGGNNGKISEEHKKKIGESHKGITYTQETKEKMREAKLGKNNPNYGKPKTQETKEKMSKKARENKNFVGNNYTRKAIYCYEFNEIRLSGEEWIKDLKIIVGSSISNCCKNKRNHTKGFHFRYATEEEINNYNPNNNTNITNEDICRIYAQVIILLYCEELNEINTPSYFAKELNINSSYITKITKDNKKHQAYGYCFKKLTTKEIEEYLINNFDKILDK